MSARINGVRWTAASTAVVNAYAGRYEISGISAGDGYSIALQLGHVSLADTFPLGVGSTMIGGRGVLALDHGLVAEDTIWTTDPLGYGGEVLITTLTTARVAGTFSFDAGLGTGSERTVTHGSFDLPITVGGGGPAPGNAGHRVEGNVPTAYRSTNASFSWPAGTSPTLAITAGAWTSLLISIENVPGTGTYALDTLPPVRSIRVIGQPGAPVGMWSSARPGGSGSVTVTSVTPQRVQGTFSATVIAQQSGTVASFPVSGFFDMGRAGP
ncbi:MAG: hypothetical protein FJ207_05240 [Gemmatimonadetes bacterium]|nr:hypothetical protein [Gemmatimonadota bacterium]